MKKSWHNTKENIEGTEGIFGQIQESAKVIDPQKITRKDLEDFLKHANIEYEKYSKLMIRKFEAWKDHWKKKRELYGEPPLHLVLMTHPDHNRMNYGTFMTSIEFYKENEKWLKPEE